MNDCILFKCSFALHNIQCKTFGAKIQKFGPFHLIRSVDGAWQRKIFCPQMPLMDLTHPSKIRLECEKDWCISCQPTKLTQVRTVMCHGVWKLPKKSHFTTCQIDCCGQTVLPVIFKRTKIGEKIPKFKWDILINFQTMWKGSSVIGSNIRSQEFSFFPWLLKSSKKEP